MELELTGKVVVVTGGTDGLGLALAKRLVLEGASVAICSRRPQAVEQAVNELAEYSTPEQVFGQPVDVIDAGALEGFANDVVQRFGRVDGLVNNAGRAAAMSVSAVSDEQWSDDLDLKLFAAIRTTRLFTPQLAQHGGAIVNVLAISGKHPGASSSPTSISRAAGLAFTKATSKDLGPLGIRANAILVGFIESGQWVRSAESLGQRLEAFATEWVAGAGIPLGRMGRADEFADLAAFLLSPRASYLTGAGINLDGGLSSAV